MNEREARQAVAEAGRILLREGLVARTWGNMSCRIDETTFAITPSGLGYESMTADDVVVYNMSDKTWRGTRKPSSEKGVHIAAYKQFPDAGFVVHTHQTYASALGLAGFDFLSPTAEENAVLGGTALAEYGLPGSKRLWANVTAALSTGAHAVLMAQHGALIAGYDQKDACERARILEAVCRRACKGQPAAKAGEKQAEKLIKLVTGASGCFTHIGCTAAPPVCEAASTVCFLRAQLDDMAQMIGPKLVVADAEPEAVINALKTRSAVLVKGLGAICRADTEGDCEALKLLTEKACVSYLHTRALKVSVALSPLDAMLMRVVYKNKYSKKIGG
ncbi:MAG TPA: class II aldolase/adducin family protein [Clostridia bacterium]|nr:class II aldolase/adducin family protein [Clostridia bacterium]